MSRRLDRLQPHRRLQDHMQQLDRLEHQLYAAIQRRLHHTARQIHALSGHLHALSPLATLHRGYAIVRRYPNGEILRRADETYVGDTVEVQLGEGYLHCEIRVVSARDLIVDSPSTC